jgi:glycopeptide antibiotics resistance protein
MVITFFGKTQSFLPYTGLMAGIAVINWLIPMLHCFLRYLFDYGTRIDDFTDFYRNTSIVFLLIYFSLLIYGAFVRNAFPWAYPVEVTAFNLLPFSVIAGQIENYLYGYIPLSGIVVYLLSRILIFIPYGFFIRLLLRRQSRLIRFFALLLLPFLIELLQYIFIPVRCDIDDLIYAAAGAFIGSLSFFLQNLIFRAFTRRDFLAKDTDYRFSSNALHF